MRAPARRTTAAAAPEIAPAGPNLFILGAQKAGTTWLFENLRAHSAIFGSQPKELFFLNKAQTHVNRNAQGYLAHFEDGRDAAYRMEASATYFWLRARDNPFDTESFQPRNSWRTPENLRKVCGDDVRLIVLLRQPTARAVSAFYHHARRGRLDAQARLTVDGARFGIIDMGFYERSAARWFEAFPRDRFLFLAFDDIMRDPSGVLRRTFAFLDLSPEIPAAVNAVRNKGDDLALHGDRLSARDDADAAPSVHAEEIAYLNDLYRPAIAFAEDALGRPLRPWRSAGLAEILTL